MTRLDAREQVEQQVRRDRAHQAEPQRCPLEPDELVRLLLRRLGAAKNLLEIGQYRAPELGEVAVGALAMEQRAAELLLEHPDRPRERRLRDVAALGSAGEVQFPAQHEEIAD